VSGSLKQRELKIGPELVVGIQNQPMYCANFPDPPPAKGKPSLHQIRMTVTFEEVYRDLNGILRTYGKRYPKATECMEKDRTELFSFYGFQASHWQHIRTTNPIE